ncbi:outer membrane protein [Pseudooceanicola algae]|uniref:Outer membrane protein beta-barrel domain-containing protein n=1 Tax=Pseudooceanicola algae TaxID=1537215 RepID=A0A418SKS8_9RHOB|nr:outer membrane beta-barrel protein [Pseudooceanicola algae]QPM90755.1 hypothetical protein PSAL_019950 [Pseudooceanicola algae]
MFTAVRQRFALFSPVLPAMAVILAASGPAMARDSHWNGFYLGGNLGWVLDADGGIGKSLHLGYNMQIDRLVVGAELEQSRTDIGTSRGHISEVTRVKMRAGYAEGRSYYYGLAGVAEVQGFFGKVDATVLGVGMDYDIGRDISIGAEFLHHIINDFNDAGDNLGVNTLTLRATLNF